MSTQIEQRLQEIARRIEMMESSLPKRIDPASISLKAKLPFKALDYREALLWRFVELCRCALDHFNEEDLAAATILTRAALETVAALWYLNRKIKSVIDTEIVGDVDNFLMRLLMGSKTDSAMPDPVNVLTFVERVNAEIDGFRQQYDELSEFSHPNWAGTSMLYSKPNFAKIWTDFGKNVGNLEGVKEVGTINLNIAMVMFEHSYNQISEMMPTFIQICERELESKSGKESN